MNLRSVVAVSVVGLAAVACSEPLEFADWTISVPEGTRIIEYAAVPDEQRTERIAFERDLVIGEDSQDPNATFFRPRDVAVDSRGRIYVLDRGNYRVQVFDSEGGFLRSVGREGQGPGEFQYPLSLAVGDDRLVVADGGNGRLGIWDLNGAHVTDAGIESSGILATRLALFPDGSVLVDYRETQSRTEATDRVVRVDWEEGIERSFVDVRAIVRIPFSESRSSGDGIRIEAPRPSFAMATHGDFYVTGSDEYQVVAMTGTGEGRWALRVAHEKAPFSEAYIEGYIEQMREYDPGVTVAHLEPNRPDYFPAIARILADGRGRLYVIPYEVRSPGEPLREEVAVDVYSSEGERLFAGWMLNREWRAARDDFVYAIETDTDSEEEVVVRYRLVGPF